MCCDISLFDEIDWCNTQLAYQINPVNFHVIHASSALTCHTDNIRLLTLSYVKLYEHLMHKLFELNLTIPIRNKSEAIIWRHVWNAEFKYVILRKTKKNNAPSKYLLLTK